LRNLRRAFECLVRETTLNRHAATEGRALRSTRRLGARFALALLPALLAACGGGGGGGEPPVGDGAQVCAPTNPYRADADGPTTTGTLDNEKAWVHSYMDEAYLWYSEMPAVNAGQAQFSNTANVGLSLDNYFNALRTPARTASGKLKDEFSFTYPTKLWNDLAGSGIVSGYGIEWYWDSSTPPRGIRVAYVEPGSPAAAAGVMRGDVLMTADGVSADVNTDSGIEALEAALFPSANGQSHSFNFSRAGAGTFNYNLVSAAVTKQPVPTTQVIDDDGRKVGYIVFNDHIASAEQGLINAVNQLKTAAVDDLVLDLRYNGGGYLYIASELAYMVAGPDNTAGKNFESLVHNNKRGAENENTPFYNTSCILDSNFNCTNRQPLPTLNLSRVTVITTGSTCSASEAIINGLRGVDVTVNVIGDTTCGKPYGFTAKDNCGISYFPIEFQGVNAKGFGDYADGFNATCPAGDDFSRQRGDTQEGMLSAALYHLRTGACDLTAAQSARHSVLSGGAQPQPRLLRGPERENRIVLKR
jgi:carboxyl-terminal processing protease